MSTRRRRVPVRFRRSAARLLLHGRRCVGNGVRTASLLAISAAAHRHKSTRIPKRANSPSNRASCPSHLTSNSESRGQSGRGASKRGAQLPPAGLKATIGQLARPVRAEEQHRKNRKKTRWVAREGSTRTAAAGGCPQSAPRTPKNIAARLQTKGIQVRSTAFAPQIPVPKAQPRPSRPPSWSRHVTGTQGARRGCPGRPRGRRGAGSAQPGYVLGPHRGATERGRP